MSEVLDEDESWRLGRFYKAAQSQEFARDFQFRVLTLGPLNTDEEIYITTSTLPGLGIHDQTVQFEGHNFHVPGTVNYESNGSWQVTFHCDEGQNIREKLIAWQKEIFSFEVSGGKYGVPVEQAVITMIGKDTKPTRQFILQGIYPVKVDDIQYDAQGDGKPLTFSATFAYQWWYETKPDTAPAPAPATA